jgi:hypothetical protein
MSRMNTRIPCVLHHDGAARVGLQNASGRSSGAAVGGTAEPNLST